MVLQNMILGRGAGSAGSGGSPDNGARTVACNLQTTRRGKDDGSRNKLTRIKCDVLCLALVGQTLALGPLAEVKNLSFHFAMVAQNYFFSRSWQMS